MAAYIRELCLRYARNELTVIQKVDIDIGVKRLLDTKQITPNHVMCAGLYIEGYTVVELERMWPNATDLLTTFFSLLAVTIDYTDEYIVQLAVRRNPKYAKTLDAYRRSLETYGRTFE